MKKQMFEEMFAHGPVQIYVGSVPIKEDREFAITLSSAAQTSEVCVTEMIRGRGTITVWWSAVRAFYSPSTKEWHKWP